MKQITIICDICGVQCANNNYTSYVAARMITDKNKQLRNILVEQNFCPNCSDKISRFIDTQRTETKK